MGHDPAPRPPVDVLMLTMSNAVGGAEQSAISLTHALRRRGWQVRSIFPRTPHNPAFVSWCAQQGEDIEIDEAVPHWGSPHTLSAFLALRRLIRTIRPRIVNLQYGGYFISIKDVLAVRLAGRHQCVVTVHHPMSWDRQNRRKRLMTYLAALGAHEIVVSSRATRDSLRAAGVPSRKLHVIPPSTLLPHTLALRPEARARLGLPDKAFVVASLARLSAEKNLDDLIVAAGQVFDPNSLLHVLVGGSGAELTRLQQLASADMRPRIHFLGYVADTADLYAAADIFVLPSASEGFGLVFIEAAYHGVPSIGVRAGGVPDAIEDGVSGLLVPPRDVPTLVQAITCLRDDWALRQRMGADARARALRKFTPDSVSQRYAALFTRSSAFSAIRACD